MPADAGREPLWLSSAEGHGGGGGTADPPLSRRAGLCLHPERIRERSVLSRDGLAPIAGPMPRILVPTLLANRSVYESLQGSESWPFTTPRRCHPLISVAQGSPNELRFHFALAGKGDLIHPWN